MPEPGQYWVDDDRTVTVLVWCCQRRYSTGRRWQTNRVFYRPCIEIFPKSLCLSIEKWRLSDCPTVLIRRKLGEELHTLRFMYKKLGTDRGLFEKYLILICNQSWKILTPKFLKITNQTVTIIRYHRVVGFIFC